jgi:hypothetical protein
MATAITNSVNYSLKPVSVKASRKTIVIPASNATTYAPQSTAIFYIPSLRSHVMDGKSGYLRFKLKPTTTGRIDVSAHSLIDRIMTYGAGGQLISDIQAYRVIATEMLDMQLSQSEKIGLSTMLGTEDEYFTPTAAAAAFATGSTPTAAEVSALVPNANRRGKAIANGTTYSFCLPILHPMFTMSEKYFPSFACADDTRIEITWSSVRDALVTCTDYEISNPEIVVDMIEMGEEVFPLIQQTYAGRDLIIPAQDYRYYSSTISKDTQGNISQIIPAKQRSVRAMFFGFRSGTTQATDGYSTGSRANPFWTAGDTFSLNIGGMRVPNKPLTTVVSNEFAPYFASTQSALHALNSLEVNGALHATYYNKSLRNGGYSATTNSFSNGFLIGVNLDSLRGQGETSNSGTDLSSVTTYWEGYMASAPTEPAANTTTTVTVDTHVLYDCLFVVGQDGNVSLRM